MVKGGGCVEGEPNMLLYPFSKVNPFLYCFRAFSIDILEFQFVMEFKIIHQDPSLVTLLKCIVKYIFTEDFFFFQIEVYIAHIQCPEERLDRNRLAEVVRCRQVVLVDLPPDNHAAIPIVRAYRTS
jgi:hypothetical protein